MTNPLHRHLKLMTRYNKWAYKQIETYCVTNFTNNPEFYTTNTNIPFKTIRNTLCHLWLSEQLWLVRMIGGTHRDLLIPHSLPRTINIRDFSQYWQANTENEGNFEQFFDGLEMDNIFFALQSSAKDWERLVHTHHSDEHLTQSFEYSDTKGKKYSNIKSDIIGHVVNHSSHHRGQISGAFTQLCTNVDPVCLYLPYMLRAEAMKNEYNIAG